MGRGSPPPCDLVDPHFSTQHATCSEKALSPPLHGEGPGQESASAKMCGHRSPCWRGVGCACRPGRQTSVLHHARCDRAWLSGRAVMCASGSIPLNRAQAVRPDLGRLRILERPEPHRGSPRPCSGMRVEPTLWLSGEANFTVPKIAINAGRTPTHALANPDRNTRGRRRAGRSTVSWR